MSDTRTLPGRGFGLSAMLLLLAACSAWAQSPPEASHVQRVGIDTGFVRNDASAPGPRVVYATVIGAPPGTPWMRLNFDDVRLAGDAAAGTGSFLRVISAHDGATQDLDAHALAVWSDTSAYFNGDAVLLELHAYPGTGESRVVITEATVGDPPSISESVCGFDEERTLSMDPRAGRVSPSICTAWLTDLGDAANRFVTAGHCIPGPVPGYVVYFNAPLSTTSGFLQYPGPEHQYPIDPASIQTSGDGGVGEDYATFQTFPNTTTDLHARQVQAAAHGMVDAVPPLAGLTLTATGYGEETPTWASPKLPFTYRFAQKTASGPYVSLFETAVRFLVDIHQGSSGSALTMTVDGQERAVGIVTHSGCNFTGGSNLATRIDHPAFRAFLDSPLRLLIPYTPMLVAETTMSADAAGADGGVVYFNVTTGENALRILKLHLNVEAESVATPFVVKVYTAPGGYQGHTSNPAAWTLAGQGNAVAAPPDEGTIVPLATAVDLAPAATYGLAVQIVGAAGHRTAAGAGAYPAADLTIETGAVSAGLATGEVEPGRTFSGLVGYKLLLPEQCVSSATTLDSIEGDGVSAFFDLTHTGKNARVTGILCGTYATSTVNVDLYTRDGSYMGYADDPAAWTYHSQHTVVGNGQVFQLDLTHTPIDLAADQTTGVCLVHSAEAGGLRYTTLRPNWAGPNMSMYSDLVKAAPPFLGTSFSSRSFSGQICYEAYDVVVPCEPDCDQSTELDLFDLLCYLNEFNAGDPGADCDDSTSLDLFDLLCFLNLFNAGC